MPEPLPLAGCTPEPLMGYLKALGVLRLLAEQLPDADVRGWWEDDVFHLQSKLTDRDIREFFSTKYKPTPIVAPWGARSGFYPDSSEATARKALEAICKSPDERLGPFREAVSAVRGLLARLGLRGKVETDEDKLRLMRACRAELPDHLLDWLDAVYVLTTSSRAFPPLLGTGGNEGSGSYVSGFAQMVVEVVVKKRWDHALDTALFARAVRKGYTGQTPGHFSPGELDGVNPWDFILALEGCCLWASGLVRRAGSNSPSGVAAFPFTVYPVAAGGPALCGRDEVKPKDAKREPAEIWLPLWGQPARHAEVRAVLAEGRATVGRATARTGFDFALAATSLGVDRGVRAFQRFAFLPRNGPSFYAAPLGRMPVEQRPEAMLVEEVRAWLDELRRKCRSDSTPARFGTAVRRIDAAVFDYCKYGGPERLGAVLAALGQAERELAVGDMPASRRRTSRPLGGLSPAWAAAADDGSPEYRLSRAVALIRQPADGTVPPLRGYLEPVERIGKVWHWIGSDEAKRAARVSQERPATAVVWSGADLPTNLGAVLTRRLLDANRAGEEALPVSSPAPVSLADIAFFLAGRTDDERLEDMLWGVALVEPSDAGPVGHPAAAQPEAEPLPRVYALLKLAVLPGRIGWVRRGNAVVLRHTLTEAKGCVRVRTESAMLARLRAGDVAGACDVATRRLRAAGFVPLPGPRPDGSRLDMDRVFTDTTVPAGRLLASLLFPITDAAIDTLGQMVLRRPAADALA